MPGNRWVIAAAGTAVMAFLGAVYAWSVYAQPLAAAFGWSSTTTTAPFAAAVFFLGVGAAAGGRWQDRAGPRRVALTGVLLWGAGNVLAGLGTRALGAPWLCLSYGLVGGLGLGLAYVTPVAAVTKWFPDRRGLGSGLVVMGFGLGAFLHNAAVKAVPCFAAASREAAEVLAARGAGRGALRLSEAGATALLRTFLVAGVVYAVVGGLCAALLRDPPAGLTPPGPAAAVAPGPDLPPARALRTPQFWMLWLMLFVNVTAGILFISNAVPILRELTGASPATAAGVYGAIALANGLGRFFWGAVSDRVGRAWAFILVYGSQAVAFLAVGGLHDVRAVAALFAVVLLGYGGGFGTMPSYTADYFGTRHLGANYGWMLMAWGVGGVVGPLSAALVKDRTGSFAGALPFLGLLLLLATLLPVLARRPSAGAGRWAHLRPPRRAPAP